MKDTIESYVPQGVIQEWKGFSLLGHGPVVPTIWHRRLLKGGKPYGLAINILADVAMWYTLKPEIDEETNEITFHKRYKADLLRRKYCEYSQFFHKSESAVQRALVYLETQGLIRRVFRTIEVNGEVLYNAMYIDANRWVIDNLTDPDFPWKSVE